MCIAACIYAQLESSTCCNRPVGVVDKAEPGRVRLTCGDAASPPACGVVNALCASTGDCMDSAPADVRRCASLSVLTLHVCDDGVTHDRVEYVMWGASR